MEEKELSIFKEFGVSAAGDSVSGFVGAIISTLFLRKNIQVKEFEKIKANKFSEVINDLLENGNMTYYEYYKCKNFLKIAKIADAYFGVNKDTDSSKSHSDECAKYDIDWFIKFYDYASSINNEDMQYLWAHILASEISSPGKIPNFLLYSLSMMRREQAEFFCNIARFALLDYKDDLCAHPLIFISTNRKAYNDSKITPDKLKELERLGLIECDFVNEYIFERVKKFRTGNKLITVYGDVDNERKIKAGNVKFTKEGQILYSLLDNESKKYRRDILDFTIERFRRRNCQITINDNKLI